MAELFVELVVTDTTAVTTKQCLQSMGLPVGDVKRYNYYRFDSEEITKDLMKTDIIANVNKHRCMTQLPKNINIFYVIVKDKEQGNGLLNTLKKLGLYMSSIEKGVVWGLSAGHDGHAIAEAAAQRLLCNKHYQEYEIR